MTSSRYTLPKSSEDLCNVVNNHVDREMWRAAPMWALWELARLYCMGYRRFTTFDLRTGSVVGEYVDKEGNLEFIHSGLLRIFNDNASRLASLDWSPSVTRNDSSLAGLRERAMAQIVSDATVRPDALRKLKPTASFLFSLLGCLGYTINLSDHPTIGLVGDTELIHPRELFPFPALNYDYTKQCGLARQRAVTLDTLVDRFGTRIKANRDKMEGSDIIFGASSDVFASGPSVGPVASFNPTTFSPGNPHSESTVSVARVRELWIEGPNGTVSEYVMLSGRYVIDRQDLSGSETYNPIGVARFFETGSFYGAGLFSLLFSLHRESERLIKALFNNIHDLDRYGVVLLPQGVINDKLALRETGKGLKVLFYEPDPTGISDVRPISIAPSNAGDIPGKTATFAEQMIQSMNPVRDLISSKGRVDSASGLQFLDEQANQAMAVATLSNANALGTAYRSACARATRMLLTSPKTVPVSRLTLDLAGAVIDPKTQAVSFKDNPIPDISRLDFSIRELIPASKTAMKQAALANLQMPGLTDPVSTKIYCLEKGIDLEIWMEPEKAAYETAVRNCLLLYGDGETPGEVVVTPSQARPDIQIMIVGAFAASPKVSNASAEVQDALADYLDTLRGFNQSVLPEGMPNPDDAAAAMGGGSPFGSPQPMMMG